jgi:hypothetical protein
VNNIDILHYFNNAMEFECSGRNKKQNFGAAPRTVSSKASAVRFCIEIMTCQLPDMFSHIIFNRTLVARVAKYR